MPRTLRALTLLALTALMVLTIALQASAQVVIVPRRTDPSQEIAFSFQQADIDDVLRFLADATGKIVFKDPAVQTQITIRNQTRMPLQRAIGLLSEILALKGYALIERENSIIVTTRDEGIRRRSTSVTAGKNVEDIPRGNQIITHIFPLTSADAVRIREELQPLFPQGAGGIMFANAATNSLVVIDEADVVRRIAEIINRLDRDLVDEVTVEVIQLQFADAAEVADYLEELFEPEDMNRQGQPQLQPGRPGQPPMPATPAQSSSLAALRGRVRFAADTRSNSLIIHASPQNIEAVKEIIAQIDVNVAPRTEYRIIKLEFADATYLADQLTQLVNTGQAGFGGFFGGFGGFGGNRNNQNRTGALVDYRVVPDVRTNSLIITAPLDAIENLEALVQRLDRPSNVQDVVRVFQLENAIASEVATTLRNLFLGVQQTGGFGFGLFGGGQRGQIPPNSPLDQLRQVTIVPNDQTNQLLISGPAGTFPVIETLLDRQTGLDRRLPQVFIEVLIADITLDDETRFGIEWNAMAGTSALGTNFGLTSPTADNTGFRYSVLSRNIQATLQALRTTDRIKIVSTPHVMVTDNSPAIISIGENIPYAGETTFTQGVAQTSVEFQDVAITLNVTPHISPGGHILMDIDQVVNSLIGFIDVGPNQVAPRTTNRRAGTTVIVQDNQTVALGGIISSDEIRSIQKIPILGDIPLLGQLFRNTTKSKSRTELVVFITPRIVTDTFAAEDIRDYERSRLQVDPLKVLDAPFKRPLEIDAERLRMQRRPEPLDNTQFFYPNRRPLDGGLGTPVDPGTPTDPVPPTDPGRGGPPSPPGGGSGRAPEPREAPKSSESPEPVGAATGAPGQQE
ncbi:MAG: secretin N-terminal domain-containing protein [Armatimonadota bacterium]